MQPKGFRSHYFSLAAIQAYSSEQRLIAMFASASTLDGKPLNIKITSPPAS